MSQQFSSWPWFLQIAFAVTSILWMVLLVIAMALLATTHVKGDHRTQTDNYIVREEVPRGVGVETAPEDVVDVETEGNLILRRKDFFDLLATDQADNGVIHNNRKTYKQSCQGDEDSLEFHKFDDFEIFTLNVKSVDDLKREVEERTRAAEEARRRFKEHGADLVAEFERNDAEIKERIAEQAASRWFVEEEVAHDEEDGCNRWIANKIQRLEIFQGADLFEYIQEHGLESWMGIEEVLNFDGQTISVRLNQGEGHCFKNCLKVPHVRRCWNN